MRILIKVVRLLDFLSRPRNGLSLTSYSVPWYPQYSRARPCPTGGIIGMDDWPAEGSLSQYAEDWRDPKGIVGGVDENRPNGSGERGMIGDSARMPVFMPIDEVSVEYPRSSSTSRFRLSVFADISEPTRGMAMYDFGADVVTPFNARRQWRGEGSWRGEEGQERRWQEGHGGRTPHYPRRC